MARTPKAPSERSPVATTEPWEARHDNDAGGPLADNASSLPDRSTRDASPAVPSSPSLTKLVGDEGPAPNLSPAPSTESSDDEAQVRSRAYAIWEERGRPDGDHEEHWREASEKHAHSKSQEDS